MRPKNLPDTHIINPAGEFPIQFYIKTKPPKKGPYVPAPHVHNMLEVGYCHSGSGIFVVADKILPFKSRDVIVINSSEPHYGQNRKGVESVWTWLYFDPVQLLGAHCPDHQLLNTSRLCGSKFTNILSPAKFPGIDILLERIVDEETNKRAYYRTVLAGYLLSLMAFFHRVPGASPSSKNRVISRLATERLQPALDYIHQHYTEKVSLDHLAKECCMSTSHFRKLFSDIFRKTPYQFILSYRISMAMADLRSGRKTCSRVAFDHGFPTLSSFMRKFKQETGASPREWAQVQ